jgi:hypothetical protein
VHGYIGVTANELDVIDTPVFQRLHNIKQLGMAYTVFPGATHTRFAHSLGVMQTIDKLVTSRGLRDHIPTSERKDLRMAALLHDVGHYPLSHVIEVVMTDHGKYEDGRHEANSAKVITKHLAQELNKNGFDPKELSQKILGKSEETLHNQLLASELDADRMDYLLRDAQNTGVRYGTHDIDRLVHSMRLDKEGRLAVYDKGMHAAEDYMIARYHMYGSVYSHKVVMGFAELVQHAYEILMKSGKVYSLKSLATLDSNQLSSFDDNYLFSKLRSSQDRHLSDIVRMIMKREPLKVAFEANMMMQRGKASQLFYQVDLLKNTDQLSKVAKQSRVPRKWIFHSSTRTQLSRLQLPPPFDVGKAKSKEMTEAIHIVDDSGRSRPLVSETRSLAYYFKQLSLGTVRIYTSQKYSDRLKKLLSEKYSKFRK